MLNVFFFKFIKMENLAKISHLFIWKKCFQRTCAAFQCNKFFKLKFILFLFYWKEVEIPSFQVLLILKHFLCGKIGVIGSSFDVVLLMIAESDALIHFVSIVESIITVQYILYFIIYGLTWNANTSSILAYMEHRMVQEYI